VLCVTGPATGVPAGVATYGGAPAAALPEDVVKPPDEGEAAPAELVVVVVVVGVAGASAGPDDGAPSALGIGGNPHLTLSCSMFCSQYVLPALPRHAAGQDMIRWLHADGGVQYNNLICVEALHGLKRSMTITTQH